MTEPYLPYQPHALDNMNTTLEAGNQTVLRQAPITTNEYLMSAIDHIDQAHPELTDATASPIAASIPSLGFGSSLSTAQLQGPARRVQGAGLRCHWPSNSPGIEMRVENQGELTADPVRRQMPREPRWFSAYVVEPEGGRPGALHGLGCQPDNLPKISMTQTFSWQSPRVRK